MLMKASFNEQIKEVLTEDVKSTILKGEVFHEYVYISFSSYGDIIDCYFTDDNDGKLMDEVSSEDWNGSSYLLTIEDVYNGLTS